MIRELRAYKWVVCKFCVPNTYFSDVYDFRKIEKHLETILNMGNKIEYLIEIKEEYQQKIIHAESYNKKNKQMDYWNLVLGDEDSMDFNFEKKCDLAINKLKKIKALQNIVPQQSVTAPIEETQKEKSLKSFLYSGINGHSILSKLQEALVKIDMIADTTLPVFRNAFLGKKIDKRKDKINWIGTIPELKHFINSLIECNKIKKSKNKWQITSQLFQRPEGDYTAEQLTHNTKSVSEKYQKLIDEILSNI
jgi:hypothetical protein